MAKAPTQATQIALLLQDVHNLTAAVGELKKSLETRYALQTEIQLLRMELNNKVNVERFQFTERAVIGTITVVLLAFAGALAALVIK